VLGEEGRGLQGGLGDPYLLPGVGSGDFFGLLLGVGEGLFLALRRAKMVRGAFLMKDERNKRTK